MVHSSKIVRIGPKRHNQSREFSNFAILCDMVHSFPREIFVLYWILKFVKEQIFLPESSFQRKKWQWSVRNSVELGILKEICDEVTSFKFICTSAYICFWGEGRLCDKEFTNASARRTFPEVLHHDSSWTQFLLKEWILKLIGSYLWAENY